MVGNRERVDLSPERVPVVTSDGLAPPFASGTFDRVLVDAPCSGIGSLRRRADARWRLDAEAPERLSALQTTLLESGSDLVKPGGTLVYSVCTLTAVETTVVAERFAAAHPDWVALDIPGDPWDRWGSGAILLPQSVGSDGMGLFRWQRPDTSS